MFRNSACYRFYSLCCMLYNREQTHGILKIGYVPLYHVLKYVKKIYGDIYDEIIDIDYDMGRPGMSIKFNMDWRIYYSPDVNIDDLDDDSITIDLIKYIADNTEFNDDFGCKTGLKRFGGFYTRCVHPKIIILHHMKTLIYVPLIYVMTLVYKQCGLYNGLDEGLKFIKKYKRYIAHNSHYGRGYYSGEFLLKRGAPCIFYELLNEKIKKQYEIDNQ